jgi:hypothetical protein
MEWNRKQRLIGGGAILVILTCCAWIYLTQTRTAKYNVGLHQRVGEVLAQETARVVGPKGRVITIAIPTAEWPELKTELESFQTALKKLGSYELREYELDTKDQPKYGVGSGLSGRRYVRTVKKNEEADAFVSFVGAPKLSDEEVAELGKGRKAKLVALARSPDNLVKLFQNQLLVVAVVSRFQFPAPAPDKPGSPEGWFTERFQIVTAAEAKSLQDL